MTSWTGNVVISELSVKTGQSVCMLDCIARTRSGHISICLSLSAVLCPPLVLSVASVCAWHGNRGGGTGQMTTPGNLPGMKDNILTPRIFWKIIKIVDTSSSSSCKFNKITDKPLSDFKAEMHQIRLRQWLCHIPHWGSLQRSPRLPSWI